LKKKKLEQYENDKSIKTPFELFWRKEGRSKGLKKKGGPEPAPSQYET
jgi:hypothetical protein